MSDPLVSIVLPTYNRAATLPRAMDSVIAQSVDAWELIIVDDGSTDATRETVDAYRGRLGDRLRYLARRNRGASAARNIGINAAAGQYVAFLDSDDEYFPAKLQRQLALFETRPDLGLVFSDYSFVDLMDERHASAFDEKLILAREVPFVELSPGLRVCDRRLFETLLRGYFIATITGMVRRKTLDDSIRFCENLRYAEEWLFYLQVADAAPAGYVNEPLCLHHFTEGSLSRTSKRQNATGFCDVLAAILRTFPELPRTQRRIVRRSLSRAQQQVAFDRGQAGQHVESARRFLCSFRQQPTAVALRRALAAIIRAVFRTPTEPRLTEPRP